MNLNQNIKILRKQKGVSQDTLAEAMGVSMQAVSKWENSQSMPDIALLPQLAEYFGVDINDLLLRNFSEEEMGQTSEETNAQDAAEQSFEKTAASEEGDQDPNEEETSAKEERSNTSEESNPSGRNGMFDTDGVFGRGGDFASRMKSMKKTIWDNWTSANANMHNGSMKRKKDELYLVMMRGDEILNQKVIGREPEVIRIELPADNQVNLNVWWSAEIHGHVGGNASAGTSIKCDNVGGGARAGTSVTCDNVGGSVVTGTYVQCDRVAGSVSAGTSVSCEDVEGDVKAGNSVNCKNVRGSVRASGKVTCTGIGSAEK